MYKIERRERGGLGAGVQKSFTRTDPVVLAINSENICASISSISSHSEAASKELSIQQAVCRTQIFANFEGYKVRVVHIT